MAAKHTPAPWTWDEVAETITAPDQFGEIQMLVYELGTNEANNRLIAAAPDLLDGCNALLGLLQLWAGRGDDELARAAKFALANNHRVKEAEEVIRKATA